MLLCMLHGTSCVKSQQQLRRHEKAAQKISGARGGGKLIPQKREKVQYASWPTEAIDTVTSDGGDALNEATNTRAPQELTWWHDPADSGLRYNKIVFPNGMVPPSATLPMTRSDYPLDMDTASWFRQSLCVSIVVEEDCFECEIPFSTLINDLGGPPSYPSNNDASVFWTDFREVVIVQEKRLMNMTPSLLFPLPVSWRGFSIRDVAEAVHNEPLGIHHLALIKMLNKQEAKADMSIIPSTCIVEFLRGVVMLNYLINWSIATVGPYNFGLKYYAGRPRPEEVAWAIHTGKIAAPHDIVEAISARNLSSAENFTAYPEGSPHHPAWPAMHSAASSASLWLPVVMNLTEAQICEVKRVDYAVAYARVVAGVHYPEDNLAGLTLGQEIVAQKLARELHEKYAADMDAVNAKIQQYRFKWEEFTTTDCYISGIYF